jgi:hypothetical protein
MPRHLNDVEAHALWQWVEGNADSEVFGGLARLVDAIVDNVLARAVPQIAQAERMRAFVKLKDQMQSKN